MQTKKNPTFIESLIALLLLLVIIGVGYLGFRLRVEILMILSAACVTFMAMRNGYTWDELETAISHRLGRTTPALLIIWMIGVVIATFLFSGSIPMLIYYGIIHISPEYVIVGACLACIVFSVVTGTSWGSAGTVGVAFLGIATAMELPLPMTVGAIICGATFGDKISPLSETTNLCAATAGANLYDHIRSMMWTTFPATLIALTVFFFMGQSMDISARELPASALQMVNQLRDMYSWGIWPLLPFAIILGGALLKKPPVPTMLLGSAVAVLVGVFFQGFSLANGVNCALLGFDAKMIPGSEGISAAAKTLLNRGGIRSMAGVVIIIYCGYAYASIISKAGFLENAIRPLADIVKRRFSIMLSALSTELLLLFFSGSSYPAAIMVPEMFKKLFLKVGMPAKTLSRSLEDVGTICAPYVPWGSSGAFYMTTFGVSIYGADGYFFWYMTGFLTPLIALFWSITGKGLYLMSQEETAQALEQYEADLKTL